MGYRSNSDRWWLAVGFLCLSAGGAAAQHPAAAKVQELFEQARPHVEAVLDARLERPPQFRCVGADEYQRQPDPDLEAYLLYRYGKAGADTFTRAVEDIENRLRERSLKRLGRSSSRAHRTSRHMRSARICR